MGSTLPVVVNQFIARGNAVQLYDFLDVRQKLKFVTPCLDIKSSGGLSFPPGANWASTNMVNLMNFTNNGLVSLTGSAYVGVDRGYGYSSYVNRGTNSAQVQFIQSDYFENPGCMIAQGGAFELDAGTARLRGRPVQILTQVFTSYSFLPPFFLLTTNVSTNVLTNATAKIAAASDITITANVLSLSNAFLNAGTLLQGALNLVVSNRLVDSGPSARSYMLASAGIQVPILPATADLMGTYIKSSAPDGTEVQHVWPGYDVGPVPQGYTNNLAVGKLTLDGGDSSVFRFSGPKQKKSAMYVDYLELLNNATNFNTGLAIDPTVIIYFANANMTASKLDGAQNGKLRWVKTFAGPLSSTNITYPSGRTYTFNSALVRDKDIDSDGDGTPNAKDLTPIFVDENIDLKIALGPVKGQVLLSWQALANSASYVEYRPSFNSPNGWLTLFITNPPVSGRVSFSDTTGNTNRAQRIYRVRMDSIPIK